MFIDNIISGELEKKDGIWFGSTGGYWSNLDKEESRGLVEIMKYARTDETVKIHHPELFDAIFSPKRQSGLELLNLSGEEKCVDYGCMWGALTIPLAKRCSYVLGIDQTLDSLKLLDLRLKEEQLDNVELLCADLKSLKKFRNNFDVAVVNGVLEWIAEEGDIELNKYFGQRRFKQYTDNPRIQQLSFLKNVYQNLNANGRLYLAIENRYDFKMFFGARDPHTDLLFTSFLPRTAADWISRLNLGRPYVNWLYSFSGIKKILRQAGFSKIDLYMSFPDYRFPERIIPYKKGLRNFRPTISLKNEKGDRPLIRYLARAGEFVIFRILRLKYLAPSIIAIGYK